MKKLISCWFAMLIFLSACSLFQQHTPEQKQEDETKIRLLYELSLDTVNDHSALLLPDDRAVVNALTHKKRVIGQQERQTRGFFTSVILRLVPMMIDIILDLDESKRCEKCLERCGQGSE